jgi:ABC-2 type transport system ATP-binding protein
MTPVLSIQALEIRLGGLGRFRSRTVLHDVSLELSCGSITTLLGPNGAGKSTLLRAALGVLKPARGGVRVLGGDPCRGRVRRSIGYVPDRPDAYDWMTARDLFRFVGPQHPGWDDAHARGLAERLGVPLERRFAELSRGQGMKAMLVAALAHRPPLVLLDEPFGGLDPVARDELLGALLGEVELEECAVLVATHDLDVAARMSDRVALLRDGRIAALGTLDEVCERDAGGETPVRALRGLFTASETSSERSVA